MTKATVKAALLSQATATQTKPLEEMNALELLSLYNSLAGTARSAKFSSKAEAVEKIRRLQEAAPAPMVGAAPDAPPAAAEAKAKVHKRTQAPKAKPASKPAAKAKEMKAASRAHKVHKVAQSGRMLEGAVIRVLVDDNPRRAGTDAHKYFAAMLGGVSVEKYLDKFPDRRKARQWLGNTVRDGYVKLIG